MPKIRREGWIGERKCKNNSRKGEGFSNPNEKDVRILASILHSIDWVYFTHARVGFAI